MSYKISFLEHLADCQFKIEASTKEDLFKGALGGMNLVIEEKDKDLKKEPIERDIEIKAPDINILLIDFLNEVLALTNIEHSIFSELEIKELTNQKIKGKIKGWKVERFKEEIKAVTYHGINVIKNDEGFLEAVILFDI